MSPFNDQASEMSSAVQDGWVPSFVGKVGVSEPTTNSEDTLWTDEQIKTPERASCWEVLPSAQLVELSCESTLLTRPDTGQKSHIQFLSADGVSDGKSWCPLTAQPNPSSQSHHESQANV